MAYGDGTWTLLYHQALDDMTHYLNKKTERVKDLRRYYEKQGLDSISMDTLIYQDQEVRGAQLDLDRATARASAYGPAAVIDELRSRNAGEPR